MKYLLQLFKTEKTSNKHHEESKEFQKTFREHVIKMQTAFEDACHPFMDRSTELINIKTKDIMSEDVVTSLHTLEGVGLSLYRDHRQVLCGKLPVTQPIKMNGFFLFAAKKKRQQTKSEHQVELLKYILNTYAKLWMTSQGAGNKPRRDVQS